MKKKIAVLGGGLSGLVASHLLQETNEFDVTIIEARKELGGQVASWEDEDGDPIEYGLHLLFPWYMNMDAFYQRIGAPLPYFETDPKFRILNGSTGEIDVFSTNLSGLLQYPRMSLKDKIQLTKLLSDALTLPSKAAEKYDSMTVRGYLQMKGLSENLIHFLETACITIQGLYGWEASAASFLKFLKHTFGTQSHFSSVCYFQEPTHHCLVEPILKQFQKNGGRVLNQTPIERILVENDVVTGVKVENETLIHFDEYISALPAYRFVQLLPPSYHNHPKVMPLNHVSSAYTIAAQIFYDQKIMLDGNTYISNRTNVISDAITDKSYHWRDYKNRGSIIQCLIDNGGEYDHLPDEQIVDLLSKEIERFFPLASEGSIEKFKVLKHREIYTETRPNYWSAVMDAGPTFIKGLKICGDWTSPPYHYGMESAVCAGIRCANDYFGSAGVSEVPILEVPFPNIVNTATRFRALRSNNKTQRQIEA